MLKKLTRYHKTLVITTGVLFFLFLADNMSGQETLMQNDLQHKVNFYNVNGKPFENPYIDVAGTPFFLEAWKYGSIKLNDNSIHKNLSLRLNLQSGEVHFITGNNIEMNFPTGFVKDVILLDSAKTPVIQYDFQCGFPAIDNQDEKNLYLVICDGKIKLLKSLRKKIIVEKNDMSGETRKEFRTYEDYYFFSGVAMQKIKKDKAYITGLLKDKKEDIEEYIKTNKIACKSIQDIQKIVDYYNSLQ